VEGLSPSHLSLLQVAGAKQGGLPFWVFYLLLSLILLLIFINFLQNKDFRQKLSYLMARPRRRLHRLRLQVYLKKEEQKKTELLRQLGELSSLKWPDLPEIEEIASEIRALEEKNCWLQAEWHQVYRRLEILKLQKRRLLNSEAGQDKPKSNLEEIETEISSLEKTRQEIQESILTTDELLAPHHQTIGQVVYRLRPDREDLAFIYFQLDRANERIKKLKQDIEKL